MKKFLIILILSFAESLLANSAPVISNVAANQRNDDSKLVDITYNLADADGDTCTIWVAVSNNGGTSFKIPARSFTGDIGGNVSPGTNKHIVWDAGSDMAGMVGSFKVRVYADDGKGPESMVVPAGWFPYQSTPNPENWVFVDSFMIGKYEVTNSQYVQFLNNADTANGSHWYSGMEIDKYGEAGSYMYTGHSGKENYPIRYVNYYDIQAYCTWLSGQTSLTYRLPAEQEWEKAAGWDPVLQKLWTYGFQRDTIDCSWCNYYMGGSQSCYAGPLPVGSFNGTSSKNDAKSYYGCYDMSGNVWEWTSSDYDTVRKVLRGGSWSCNESSCRVVYRQPIDPSNRSINVGFRLVLDID